MRTAEPFPAGVAIRVGRSTCRSPSVRPGMPLLIYGEGVTPEALRRVLERPGRVAAISGAAVVCVLTVSGALGIAGPDAGGAEPRAAVFGADARSLAGGGGDAVAGGNGSADADAPHSTHVTPGAQHQTAKPPAPSSAQPIALPHDSGTGKRIVFDVSAQRVWLVDADNSVERTYLVSGSKFDNLQNDTYQVTSRSRYATAYNSDETMNYMVRFAMGRTSPIGFHSIPALPDGTLVEDRSELGAPASDGCIRQWITDARALWNFAPVGTTVVVRA
jgi:hypothetical protein